MMNDTKALAEKLGIKDGRTVGLLAIEEHADFPDIKELGIAAPAVSWADANVVLWPAATENEVRSGAETNFDNLSKASIVWICYKKGNAVAINREKLWIILADYKWKAVSQVSLTDTWSALRVRPMTVQEKANN